MMGNDKINKLAEMVGYDYNIASFIGVTADQGIQYKTRDIQGDDLRANIEWLLQKKGSVNVRSYSLEQLENNRFEMGVTEVGKVLEIVKENGQEGRKSIINENIDVADGGVSGVIVGDVIEFSPEDTPRCVDKPGLLSLPLDVGRELIKAVYGIEIQYKIDSIRGIEGQDVRIEFSIHPSREGVFMEHMIIWEVKKAGETGVKDIRTTYPNNFSRFIGDKAYGLLLADLLGFSVPRTRVISKKVAPFEIGYETGEVEKWVRTAPREKAAGKYYTGKGWVDIFELMTREEALDGGEDVIGSILVQDGVLALYSGAGLVTEEKVEIEGVKGEGEAFMQGEVEKEEIPGYITEEVEKLGKQIQKQYKLLGPMTFEWVMDTRGEVWLVQMNQIELRGVDIQKGIILEGDVESYKTFYVAEGLDKLREIVKEIDKEKQGVIVKGDVGVTSHIGDVLRAAGVVSKIES